MNDRVKMWLLLVIVIILETATMTLLEYSANNHNNYYILGIILYAITAYIFYRVLIIGKLGISNALWNVSTIILITLVSIFYFKEELDIYGKFGIMFAILSVILMEYKNLRALFN